MVLGQRVDMPLLVEQANTSKMTMVPAPLGGLNVYDNLLTMPPTDAVSINNLVPQPYGCMVRKGYQEHVTGLGGPIETLGSWPSRSGTTKLFAFAQL